jgi:4a-hydroxytetrahydrobiopterin dehydratase
MKENIELASKECVPCRGGIPPLAGDELKTLSQQLGNGWEVIDAHHLSKGFTFKNFTEALSFVNRVGDVAEEQNHHPDLYLSWGKVRVEIWTHKINGLTESDFIFAAKADQRNQPI